VKAVTEFPNFLLNKAQTTKAGLLAEGKTPEEIQQSIGEAFKYEGDKITYFMNAIEVASQNTENLKRVLVMSLAEGEKEPAKAVKLGELYYVPEFIVLARPKPPEDEKGKGRKGRGGGRGGDRKPKESPWGLSPEEKAAKAAKKTTTEKV
jgi:hypothetical protein